MNSWRTPEFNPPGRQAVGPEGAAEGMEGAAAAQPADTGRRDAGPVRRGRRAAGRNPAEPAPEGAGAEEAQARRRKKGFDERYHELTLYYLAHGHCLVPVSDPSGAWGGAHAGSQPAAREP